MTQNEVDKMIAEKMPQVQLLVNLSETDYIMLRYEIGVQWLSTLGYTPIQQMIISKCETYWVWYHVVYLRADIRILRTKHLYQKLNKEEIRQQYILDHLAFMPDRIPHTPMHEIMLDARDLVKIKRLMQQIRERLTQVVGVDFEAVKKDARMMWQDINPNVIIDDDVWEIMWQEIEQAIKTYNDKESPDDFDFVAFVGETINQYQPENIPQKTC